MGKKTKEMMTNSIL